VNPGARTAISFNVDYCLGVSAFVYAQIYGNVRDSMGVEILVNGSREVISKADTEGWISYESASTIVSSTDCFRIRTVTATGTQNVAWFRTL